MKKKAFDIEDNLDEETIDTAPEPEYIPAPAPPPPPPAKKYVGPKYKYGIIIPGTTEQVQPMEMTEEEIADLVARYPEAKNWWE